MEPRFLADINVARLAKWLRALGYDATIGADLDDAGLVRQALGEGRTLLTKDTRLVQRGVAVKGILRVLLILHDGVREQLRQVVAELKLDVQEKSFSRCIRCYLPLESASREQVRERLPPYVYENQPRFTVCPSCGRVYWPGTHWRNMRAELARVTREGP
jgi:hypothetical protein